MGLKALVYAYVLGGLTFLPIVIFGLLFFTVYTSVPVGDPDVQKEQKAALEKRAQEDSLEDETAQVNSLTDVPRTKKAWMTMRRTFEESETDSTYVNLVRGFLDARSKDPKRQRPKDMWYCVLKGKVLYLYEDEDMTECEAALELSGHDVLVYPEGQQDAELFAKRNAICLRPRVPPPGGQLPSVTKEMKLDDPLQDVAARVEEVGGDAKKREQTRKRAEELAKRRDAARQEASNLRTPWFIFVRSNFEMEDWYLALIHASDNAAGTPTLTPLRPVFRPSDMSALVDSLDAQPDVIPTRWLNAIIGRIFFSYYRTHVLEQGIIARLMKKLGKVKFPAFLTDVVVKEVSLGNKPPMFSKPMLKELTPDGDTSVEVHLAFKGEIRITVEATATINLGTRFKSYTVKLVLAAILRELEGNLLIKIKRPPSSRLWYAFTQMPRMVLSVEPVVSDRQITWSMITSAIESQLKEIIMESVVMPEMDDIAFFDSANYEHRGGLWADASRRNSAPDEPTPENEEPPVIGELPNASSPVLGAAKPKTFLDSSLASDVDPRSASVPDVGALPTTNVSPSSGVSTATKRRTWFSGTSTSPVPSETEPNASTETVQRGRAQEAESQSYTPARSKSTPNEPSDVTLDAGEITGALNSDLPLRSFSSRASRSSSRPREPPVSGDLGNALDHYDDNGSDSGVSTSASAISRSSTYGTGGSTSTTGLLSQLKARAAATDKQELANQAKETMKKWSMTWSSKLKRNSISGSADEAQPDAGDAEPRGSSPSSGLSGDASKPRPTFAEMRAKVEERRAGRQDTSTGSSPSSLHAASPIAIPYRSDSDGLARNIEPLAPSLSSSSTGGRSVESAHDVPSLPGPSLSTSPQRPRSSGTGAASGGEESETSRSTAPVYTRQPLQARTMMIPGIHSAHKGEVMSMGYTPPPAPAPAAPTTPDTRARVTSMYSRLWKTTQQQQQAGESSGGTASSAETPGGEGPDEQSSTAGTPGRLSPDDTAAPPSPVPPPLPPRRTAASEALQRIAAQDSEARGADTSKASTPADTASDSSRAPPLPPRRTPTAV